MKHALARPFDYKLRKSHFGFPLSPSADNGDESIAMPHLMEHDVVQSRSISPFSFNQYHESNDSVSRSDEFPASRRNSEQTATLVQPAGKLVGKAHKQSFWTRIFKDSWAGEVVAWGLAALCMTAIVTLLAIFHDQNLTSWHSRVTINALINLLSQFAQSAMVIAIASAISQLKWIWLYRNQRPAAMDHFDEASRQPLDSMILLFRYPRW